MLDTVIFKLTRTEVEGVDFLSEITPYLNPDGLCVRQYNWGDCVTGDVEGLNVSVCPNQVRVNGSICKWMLGDNYQTLRRGGVKRAVERLSDTLHLPMERAIITRLDVGLSIVVREPIANYFNHLGVLKYAQRLQQPNSLYYHQQAERLCFYDKNREQRDHREPIPEIYRDANVLRYEQRYMARLPQLLGEAQVTAAMLYDERFYISLLNRWRDAYQAIRKVNEITLNFQAMKTKRDLQKMGILVLVEQWGGELATIAHINEAQKRGELTAKQAFDLRQGIKDACKVKYGLTAPSAAIGELDKKISEAINLY